MKHSVKMNRKNENTSFKNNSQLKSPFQEIPNLWKLDKHCFNLFLFIYSLFIIFYKNCES